MVVPGRMLVIRLARFLAGPWLRLCFMALKMIPILRPTCRDQLGAALFGQPRQLSNESDCGPKLVIVVIAPGGHAGHLDPVFDDPEKLTRSIMFGGFGKIGRLRIKPDRDVALGHARSTVANGAMRRKMLGAGHEVGRIIESWRHGDADCVSPD